MKFMGRLGERCFVFTWLVVGSAVAAAASPRALPECAMNLALPLRIHVPRAGFRWLPGEELSGDCEDVGSGRWTTAPAGDFNLMVDADGPYPEGRFWNITVGLAPKRGGEPHRGFCVEACTIGWRTLLSFKRLPLPWVADLDGDGAAELMLWDSFPTNDNPSAATNGLVAWVYRLDSRGTLAIDWPLTRMIASELAAAYREPLPAELGGRQSPDETRIQASRELQDLADERCRVRHVVNELP